MVRGLGGIAVALAIGGCSLDTSGVGSGSPLGPGGSSPGSDGTQDDEGSADTLGDEGDSGMVTSGVDGTADGPSMDSGPGGHPGIIISDGPTYDFGPLVIKSPLDHLFTITNEGDAPASVLKVVAPTGAFSLLANDCPDTLGPGESCGVQVRFAPELFGAYAGELGLTFQDAGMPASASRGLQGRGVGITADLVVNGGGEQGNAFDLPPPGWDGDANWSVSSGVTAFADDRTLYAGALITFSSPTVIHQSIDVAQLTLWSDAAGVTFHFSAHHRAQSMNDNPTTVVLRFLAGDGSDLGANPSGVNAGTTWMQHSGSWVAPPGTVFVRVELVCASTIGFDCNGHFDAVQLMAEWQG